MKKNLLKFIIICLLLSGSNFFQDSIKAEVISVNELTDINKSDWAYDSVKYLVEKYGIQGYQDGTFKGNKKASRYELASALGKVAVVIGDRLAELGVEKADQNDLKMVIKLQREFQTELAAFKLRAEAIERKNIDQDASISDNTARLDTIEKVKHRRDILVLNQSDMSKAEIDAIDAIFRVRNDTEVTYHQNNPDGFWGEGSAFFRLTGAVGRQGHINSAIPTGNVLNLFNDVATDVSSYAESTQANGGFSLTRGTAFIEQAIISQDMNLPKDGVINFSAGLMDITNYFDLNAVANSENTQFTNLSLINNRAFTPIYISPGFVFNYDQPLVKDKLNLSVKAGMLAYDTNILNGAYSAIYEGGLQYFIKNKEGNIRVGGYNTDVNSIDKAYVSNRIWDRFNSGLYLSFDQQLYKNLKGFCRYGVADSGPVTQALNNTRQALSFGAEIPIYDIFKVRENDMLGIAYAMATPITNIGNNPLNLNTTSESILEVYYKAQINDMLSIGPDLQVIWSPGGFDRPITTVLGLRTYLTF